MQRQHALVSYLAAILSSGEAATLIFLKDKSNTGRHNPSSPISSPSSLCLWVWKGIWSFLIHVAACGACDASWGWPTWMVPLLLRKHQALTILSPVLFCLSSKMMSPSVWPLPKTASSKSRVCGQGQVGLKLCYIYIDRERERQVGGGWMGFSQWLSVHAITTPRSWSPSPLFFSLVTSFF